MKIITIALLFCLGIYGSSFAQTTTTTSDTTTKMHVTKKSTGVNKDGTPDMRLKANKQAKAQAQVVAPPQAQATTTTQSNTQVARVNTIKTSDKVIETDTKGRTIYQGPRGGKYFINKNGNKEYVK